jgi:hypothetical protein
VSLPVRMTSSDRVGVPAGPVRVDLRISHAPGHPLRCWRHDGVVTDSSDGGARDGRRRFYRSDPYVPSRDSLTEDFTKLARAVYTGLRDGGLDREATFDLACWLMDWGPFSQAVLELAKESAQGTDALQLAGLAAQVLEESGWRPGFDAEPRLLAELENALEAVKADMHATGLAGPVGLSFADNSDSYLRNVFADFRGHFSWTSGIAPDLAADRVSALLAVADDVQDAVMGHLMMAWPACPEHRLGAHPVEHDRQAVWWCNGSPAGHVIAPIGHWNA